MISSHSTEVRAFLFGFLKLRNDICEADFLPWVQYKQMT